MSRTFENEEQVASFMKKENRKLVIYQGVVYEVGEYMDDHPGGNDLIEDELGTNIDEKFEEAEHTKAAKKIFKDLEVVGKMKNHDDTSAGSSDEDQEEGGAAHMDGAKLGCTRDFDYSTGLWEQIWKCDWSFEEYYVYINEPKVLVNPVRNLTLFKHPFREILTMTPWWLIPVVWTPGVIAMFMSVGNSISFDFKITLFVFGLVMWSLTEYLLHRFLFHCEDLGLFPRHSKVYAVHFLVHGIHHAFPQDKYRLVFPPILGAPIFVFLFELPWINVFGWDIAHSMLSGMMLGYVAYDMVHYYLHHCNPQKGYWRELKLFHMQHHYKNGALGFGVSQKFWDVFFNTDIPTEDRPKLK